MFALGKIGACIVPLNSRYRTDDVAYTLSRSRSATMVTLDRSGPVDYQGMLMESMPEVRQSPDRTLTVERYPDLKRLVVLGERRLAHAHTWDALLAAGTSISDDPLALRPGGRRQRVGGWHRARGR
jgi:fatty-acyl-CoA synthase